MDLVVGETKHTHLVQQTKRSGGQRDAAGHVRFNVLHMSIPLVDDLGVGVHRGTDRREVLATGDLLAEHVREVKVGIADLLDDVRVLLHNGSARTGRSA